MSMPILESSTTAAAARRVSTGSTNSAADKRADILRALKAESSIFKNSPYGHDSALETEAAASASSLDLSAVVPPSQVERIRRRSELPRVRTPQLGEAIELPVLSPIDERNNAQSSAVASGPSQLSFSKTTDVEIAPTPYAPSLDYTAETTPAVTPAQRAAFRRNARIQFFALCYSFFLEGWNDGSTGPLLPRIERTYHIGFAIVSMLFVTNCVGFLSGAVMNVWLNQKLGLGKVLVLGAVFQLIGYTMMAPGGPFWVMCIAFVFAGYGISLQNAQANGYVGNLKDGAHNMFGFLHASYGFGALVSPLVATQFSSADHWSFHYLISAGIAVSNLLLLGFVFRLKDLDQIMAEAGEAVGEPGVNENLYHQIMRLKEVHYLAMFSLIYVGVEVSIGGWIVTFIEDERGGGASAGYISSGFFGGLMLGRILLMQLNRKLGERWVIVYYSVVVIILEVTIWVVPSLIENAIAVSVVGLLMGPIYPVLMNQSTGILPKWLLTGCLGYIGGIGQAGSAVLPFITGLISSKFGIASLQPFIVSMMSTMIIIWALVPKARRIE
ncbi:MFS general substrate transporter [Fomitopsis serialis]|uniref:MFS general substrate transporter n=1 Tax=Fomitopsis serialis TaxID=139415 RepID=UPI0020089A35|nr:MFS general substrate transporter [Neoantrodia serialis]KAH9933057.1 MFS general substrate transporter [Neoantrodia serialis]